MRTFVYLDTNILNSYISQTNGGLITRKQQEALESTKESNMESSSEPEDNIELSAGFRLATIKVGNRKTGVSNMEELSRYDYGKELIEKVLHDNAVQDLIDTLKESGELKEDPAAFAIGDYVLFKADYDIFDVGYWRELATTSVFSDIVKSQKSSQKTGNRKERRAQKQNNTTAKDVVTSSVSDIINMLCKGMPYSQMVITHEHFIPVEGRFLRESLQSIRFKYGSKISILGRITSTPEIAQRFSSFMSPQLSLASSQMNAMMFEFVSSQAKWITTPIALFFE